mmetsp:Transcript_5189/g.11393  ORF Transcript_5189/g.11393 Transcript_5189/m.11393 type:complete len:180 (-) Transcript_5189:5276-5815(-)
MRWLRPRWLKHENESINSVDFTITTDGEDILATSGADGTIKLWSVDYLSKGGHPCVRELKAEVEKRDSFVLLCVLSGGHSGPVNCIRFSSDGLILASAGDDGVVVLWTFDAVSLTWLKSQTLRGHGSHTMHVSWHPGGSELASASIDGRVLIWKIGEGSAVKQLEQEGIKVMCCNQLLS